MPLDHITNATSTINNHILSITLSLISFIAVVGNLFNLMIIYRCRSLNNINTYLIANLAVIDLMTGLITLPIAIIVVLNSYYVHPILCQFQAFLVVFFYGASLSTTTAISFDRCIAISLPYYYNSVLTYQRIKIQVVILWLLPLFMAISPIVGLGRYSYTSTLCWINISDYSHNFWITIISIIYIFTSILITVICNIITLIIAYPKRVQILTGHRNIKKSLKTTLLIVGTKLITWLPLSIMILIEFIHQSNSILPSTFAVIAILLSCSNAASNPIIYLLTNQNLATKLKLWLRRRTFKTNIIAVAPSNYNQPSISGNLIAMDKTSNF